MATEFLVIQNTIGSLSFSLDRGAGFLKYWTEQKHQGVDM
jgi:hypothetical protein